jgi:hypothetical protein
MIDKDSDNGFQLFRKYEYVYVHARARARVMCMNTCARRIWKLLPTLRMYVTTRFLLHISLAYDMRNFSTYKSLNLYITRRAEGKAHFGTS